MGRSQKMKGNRTEREFAKIIGGQRTPLSGAMGFLGEEYVGDVKGLGLTWECKVRKQGFTSLYTWLEKVDALAVKADRKKWLVVMELDTFMEGWKGG